MPADSARNYFLNRANDQDVRWALNALQPQPFQPFADRMDMKIFYQLTVPKLFVLGKDDHALPMEYWIRFAHRLGCQPVEIDSDHSPMISHPKLLADILVGG
jgi:pimeloyl-ACP methyl ester carboxylesterase